MWINLNSEVAVSLVNADNPIGIYATHDLATIQCNTLCVTGLVFVVPGQVCHASINSFDFMMNQGATIGSHGAVPVSYTHLDVYKRQAKVYDGFREQNAVFGDVDEVN